MAWTAVATTEALFDRFIDGGLMKDKHAKDLEEVMLLPADCHPQSVVACKRVRCL